MRSLQSMLSEYSESHQNRTNQIIHKICVPAIMISLLGLLWLIPAPEMGYLVNWATIFCALCLLYYVLLSFKYFLFMLPATALMIYSLKFIDETGYLLSFSVITFVLSWVLQVWGHKIEGKKPSFIKDLLFLLIGPLWVTKSLFNLKD